MKFGRWGEGSCVGKTIVLLTIFLNDCCLPYDRLLLTDYRLACLSLFVSVIILQQNNVLNACMPLAPSIVYSAVVINKASRTAILEVTYAMPDRPDVVERVSVGAGGTLRLEQKILKRGSAVFTRCIRRIVIEGSKGPRRVLQAPFERVRSPVKDYVVEIYPVGHTLQLRGLCRVS